MCRMLKKYFIATLLCLMVANSTYSQCNSGNCSNGQGTYKYENGTYTGGFVNSLRDGQGTYNYTDGNKFVGTYSKGEKVYGTFYYKTGSSYTGNFKNDKRHGYGKAVSAKGEVKEGEWANGDYVGPSNPVVLYAVVVGISDYRGSDMDLQNADDDANDYYSYLINHGSSTANTFLLTDASATKAAIVNAMTVFSKADNNDKIIFFFSGHGYKNGFVPADFSVFGPLLPHSEVRNAFKTSAASFKLCIADACFSGNIRTDNGESSSSTSSGTFDKNEQIAVFMSSRSYQTSSDGNVFSGNGLFTSYLLKGLQGQADANSDKLVTISELYTYVRTNVEAANADQVPVLFGKFDLNMVMSKLF